MLGYFPRIYPDEIFYSICARYHRVSAGRKGYGFTAQELFDKQYAGKGIFFPSKLNTFISKINKSMGTTNIDAIDIINNHTIFPLLKPFVSKPDKMRLISSLLAGVPASYKFLELLAIPNGIKSDIKFCIDCILESQNQYGEAYFNRIHQIPGNDFCLKHNKLLYKCKKDELIKKRVVFCADDIDINKYSIKSIDRSLEEEKYNLAIDIQYVIEKNLDKFDINIIRKRYIQHLEKWGLYETLGSINHRQIYYKYIDYYSVDFLKDLGFAKTDIDYNHWLQNVPYITDVTSPIRHLLFIRLISGDAKTFFEEN